MKDKKKTVSDVIYARYSSNDQNATSIDDQVRRVREYAERVHSTRPAHVIFDKAESVKDGTAPNWQEIMDGVRKHSIKRVFVDEASRVTRDMRCLLHLIAVFKHYDASLISVYEQVDLTREQSQIQVMFSGLSNQRASQTARHRVKRGMDGNLERGLSCGDVCFGYNSAPLSLEEAQERGLPPRPEDKAPYRKLVINEAEAEIARRIHGWFAVDKISMCQITRKLNYEKVPRGRKARRASWKQIDVRKILQSRRYLGYRWRNKTEVVVNPDTGKREIKQQDATLYVEYHYPELVIIDQETFERTVRRFDEVHKVYPEGNRGWKVDGGSPSYYSPKNLLSGNLVCGKCGGMFVNAGGHNSGYLRCSNVSLGLCNNRVTVNREYGKTKILEAILGELDEEVVVDYVYSLLKDEVDRLKTETPDEADSIKTRIAELGRQVERLTEAIALADDINSLIPALRNKETEMRNSEQRLRELEQSTVAPIAVPDRDWVVQQFRERLPELLRDEVKRAAMILRQITGPIEIFAARKPWLHRDHAVARISVDIARACGVSGSAGNGGRASLSAAGFGVIKEIEFRERPYYEEHGNEVVRLRDEEGLTFPEIAKRLPGDMNAATMKIAYNFGKYGTPDPGDRGWKRHCRQIESLRDTREKKQAG